MNPMQLTPIATSALFAAIGRPYYWWQHPSRLTLAVRLGITRMLLERRA